VGGVFSCGQPSQQSAYPGIASACQGQWFDLVRQISHANQIFHDESYENAHSILLHALLELIAMIDTASSALFFQV
jgi:hypothetical protein